MKKHLMKCKMMALAVVTLALAMPAARAQQRNARPSRTPQVNTQIYVTPRLKDSGPEAMASVRRQAATGQTIPLWTYSTVAQDGKTYTGSMVGRSPFAHGHRVTTVPTYLQPVKFTFADSGDVFDPTVFDGCGPANESVMTVILNSPLFGTPDFTLNGAHIGVSQYVDAFQRASFWTKVSGTPYHTQFSTSPTVLPVISVTVPTSEGSTQSYQDYNGCQDNGKMDYDWWNKEVQTVIMPQLAAKGVGPANFPQFVFDSVSEYTNGNVSDCCVLGWHDEYQNNGTFQTYSVNEYDTSGAFGGSTRTMSHEIAEWLDDPAGTNPVPDWGHEGQQSSCQNNLEVGDPLSAGYSTPTASLYLTNTGTGVQYELQELAFYSWFLDSSPSLGAGGKYSDNGTFTGYAKPCPPGGTN